MPRNLKPRPAINLDLDIIKAAQARQRSIAMVKRDTFEEHTLVGGQTIYTHRERECWGYWCPIHNQSPHHMVRWEQRYDWKHNVMVRVCEHGEEHPDPDEPHKDHGRHDRLGCCGCCSRSNVKRGK